MRRVLLFAILSPLCFSALNAQQPPVLRGSSEIVRVFATVTDRDGRLVTDLTREQFEVRDQGKPQPITTFDSTPQPIQLVVMLDVSGSMEGNLPLLREASDELFRRLREDDVARVGSFGREIVISPAFTRDVRELRAALPRGIAPDAPTPLWAAIDRAMDAFDRESDRRRVVLVLSDGKDTGPIDFRRRPVSQSEVIDRARADDVMVYGVGMRSRPSRPPTPGPGPRGMQEMLAANMADPGLARVAEDTGGGYLEIRFGEDLASAFASVADELHTQYLLGFAPPARDGKRHEINVRLTRGGVKARARKDYLAPKS